MKRFVSLVLLLALLGANAYDFDNSDFNAYLLKEFQSLQDYALVSDLPADLQRSRRDTEAATSAVVDNSTENLPKECAKRSWKKDMNCCKGSNVNGAQLELFKNIKKECIAELKGEPADDAYDPFDCEKMQQVKKQIVCISECMAKKHNGLDEAGELKRDIILKELRVQIGDLQWKQDALEGYVDKCLVEAKEKREQHAKEGKVSEGCSTYPLAFQSCMWQQFWNGCPAELQVDTPRCNKLRGRVAEGNIRFFGKHFLYKYYPMGSD